MNLFHKYLFVIFFAFCILAPSKVFSQTESLEKIDNYFVEIQLEKTGTLQVIERIEYDFSNAPRHGIFRTIPYAYKARGGNFNLRLNNFTVTDENRLPQPFVVNSTNGVKEIKIGDPEKTITGKKTYIISYSANRALNYFSDHDELYWNAIGTDWSVPILHAQTTITFPFNILEGNMQSACFVGEYENDEEICGISVLDEYTVVYMANEGLTAGQALTVLAGFNPGLVSKPSWMQNFKYLAQDNWIVGLPFLLLIILILIWNKIGKDEKGRGTIIAEYDSPESLSPLEIGTLLDENVNHRDISAQIINLAVRGFIKISKKETTSAVFFKKEDYYLEKLKDYEPGMETYDKDILQGIFGGGNSMYLSDLKKHSSFYFRMEALKKDLYENLTKQKFFKTNPANIRRGFVSAAGIVSFFASFFGLALIGSIAFWSIIACGIILIIFAWLMPARTQKGAEIKERIEGLKLFLNATEKERLKFLNAPETNPKTFEKLLPYAMVLGVEKQWAEQFKDIYNYSPTWYASGSNQPFTPLIFNNFTHNFTSAIQFAAPSPAGGTSAASGGSGFSGGFSGGGFGGGGGGSW